MRRKAANDDSGNSPLIEAQNKESEGHRQPTLPVPSTDPHLGHRADAVGTQKLLLGEDAVQDGLDTGQREHGQEHLVTVQSAHLRNAERRKSSLSVNNVEICRGLLASRKHEVCPSEDFKEFEVCPPEDLSLTCARLRSLKSLRCARLRI